MKKITFSLKKLRLTIFTIATTLIVGGLILVLLMLLLLNILTAYTKGSSLLIIYTQNYFLSIYDDTIFSEEKNYEFRRKIEGFYAFYELLFSRERPYGEIEKLWLDFGMSKGEIPLVVYGTIIMRALPILNDVKASAERLKAKIDLARKRNISKEDIDEIVIYLVDFHKSFYSSIRSILIPIAFIIFLLIIILAGILSASLFRNLSSLTKVVKIVSDNTLKALRRESYEILEIIDPKSDFAVLQEAVNLTSEKLQNITLKKERILDKISEIVSMLHEKVETVTSYIPYMENLKENISNISSTFFSSAWDSLSRSFSLMDAEVKKIYTGFDKLRALSSEIFEPTSTVYEILETTSSQYKLAKEIAFNYTSDI
ncbi:MAG: hypothetical protein ABDH28_00675 [Brevinematia bacterium]